MYASESKRPGTPQKSKSFTRLESPRTTPPNRSRANTIQHGIIRSPINSDILSPINGDNSAEQDDIFEKDSLISGEEGSFKDLTELDSANAIPEDFDELPIELVSLIDRFVESLSAKIHNTPPSIEKLSGLFQDFYIKSEAHITTHIKALSTKQARISSPNPSVSSRSSNQARELTSSPGATKKEPPELANGRNAEQQMLTPQEISDRRKARRLLDKKATALEEAVERRVCERVYDRIWRHRSTLDEVRDDKLRSRTAALALVGISLKDLGIDLETAGRDLNDTALQAEVGDWIAKARDGLLHMNEARFPLGKLQQLTAAHKSIVDLLTSLHQSSSSADEILPTLIYTLITTPPEGINVISNLHFIQRFRAYGKVDGEAAYCLTNLEAAVTFLETVDLASLRADEVIEGPPKPISRTGTPIDRLLSEENSVSTVSPTSAPMMVTLPAQPDSLQDVENSKRPPLIKTPSHHRRLSDMLQPPAHALGAASDAVRNTADQGLKTVGNTLDNSFRLLFGRLQEQKVAGEGSSPEKAVTVPRTLDDARRLMDPKPANEDDDSVQTPVAGNDRPADGMLSIIAGRKQPRDRSVDSNQSSGSGKRVSFLADAKSQEKSGAISPLASSHEPSSAGASAVESMRNLGNSLNPLRGFGGMGGFRGFGRTSSSNATLASTSHAGAALIEKPESVIQDHESAKVGAEALPPIKVAPPIPKFLDAKSVSGLKIGEVAELLDDYKRLARALDQLGAL